MKRGRHRTEDTEGETWGATVQMEGETPPEPRLPRRPAFPGASPIRQHADTPTRFSSYATLMPNFCKRR
jgi:hypothetical protein